MIPPVVARRIALAVLLGAVTIAAYSPALRAGYVWDDDDYVTENPLLTEPDGLGRIWFSMDAPSQFVPMVYTTLRIEYGFWGLDPFGYHLVNVLLHLANALLLWLLCARLRLPAPWFVAAVFALHPVHVESVAWISERKNVLSLFFSLLSMIAWLRFIDTKREPRHAIYVLSLTMYALALLSKATACTQPAAMLLIPWMRAEPIGRRRIAQVIPFLSLGVGMGFVIMFWERFHIGTQGDRFALSFAEALQVAPRACWFYLEKLIWPAQLTFSYPRFEVDPRDPLLYGWLVAGGVLLATLWRSRTRIGRAPIAAALFFIATLSPVLGFIPLYTFSYTFVADHYQYVASIGPIALLVGGAAYQSSRWGVAPRVSATLGVLLLAVLAASTYEQSRIYEDRETLWRDTATKNPSSWMAQTNLGRHYLENERWEDAAEAYRAALQIRPATYRANLGLAKAMWGLGRNEDMRQQYELALLVEPDLLGVHQLLAESAWERGDIEPAIRHLEAMARIAPGDSSTYVRLGRALERLERFDQARAQYEQALAADPDSAAARRGLARLRARARRMPGQ
jgi:tetratricopeptide (TPR) repeat protein